MLESETLLFKTKFARSPKTANIPSSSERARLTAIITSKAAKTKEGVETILSRPRASGDNRNDESQESEFEMDGGDEPWQGTQLQRFMTTSARKDMQSLTGLQGVISHTRAAAGFGKAELRSPSKASRNTNKTLLNGASADLAGHENDDEGDDDTDDLDAPVRPPPPRQLAQLPRHRPASPPKERQSFKATAPKAKSTAPRSFLDMSPPSPLVANSHPNSSKVAHATKHKPRRERSPSPLRASKDTKADPAAAIRAKLKARREREESHKKSSATVKDVEIPLFLV